MKVRLPVRIFLAHLLLTLGAGAVLVWLVRDSFEKYFRRWEQGLATLPAEQLLNGVGAEVARAFLLRAESLPEVKERDQKRITDGLRAVLSEIPSVESILILDRDRRIQFASETWAVDLAMTGPERASFFASDSVVRRQRPSGRTGLVTEVMVPVFDGPSPGRPERRRLGSLLVTFRPDPTIVARLPELRPPSIPPGGYAFPLLAFGAAVVVGGLAVGLLTALPVRRLDRALREFRARGYRGPIDAKALGLEGELAQTVSAINEMGGRLEALDSRGREREALLATLSHSLEEGMVALDARGIPVAWNDAAARLLASNDDGTPVEARLRRTIESCPGLLAPADGPAAPREVELQVEGRTDGPVRVTEVPFELRPGESGTLLLLRDLATLRQVEAHLLEAGRFAVLAHLAGSLAHEIRNPLHSIGLNAGVVEQYVGAPATEPATRAMTESLRTIQDETRRLTELLNNYLGMLRSSPEPAPVDLRELCRRVIQLLSYAALKSRVEVRLEGDETLPAVEGVPDRLQQAVLNLVLNAIQAMPQGGSVVLRTEAKSGVVRLTVEDTGPGLPAGMEEAVFDTRVTTKPGGSGLGLPLVRLIAEAHGGSVWYRSTPGKGATFTLVLPARVGKAA